MIQSPRPDASAPYSPAMSVQRIALDATYSVGENLSGVGVYSRELLRMLDHGRDGLAAGYAAASVIAGFLAVAAATAMVRRVRIVA